MPGSVVYWGAFRKSWLQQPITLKKLIKYIGSPLGLSEGQRDCHHSLSNIFFVMGWLVGLGVVLFPWKKYIPCGQIPDCGFGKIGSLKQKVHLPQLLTWQLWCWNKLCAWRAKVERCSRQCTRSLSRFAIVCTVMLCSITANVFLWDLCQSVGGLTAARKFSWRARLGFFP